MHEGTDGGEGQNVGLARTNPHVGGRGRASYRQFGSSIGCPLLILLFSACQSSLHVVEPRQVAVPIVGAPFAPPPRTISDLTVLLDQIKPNTEVLTALRSAAAAEPSPELMGTQLAEFLHQRGEARARVGQMSGARADFVEAIRLGKQTRVSFLVMFSYVRGLANLEETSGRHRAALRLRQDRLTWVPAARQDLQIGALHAICQSPSQSRGPRGGQPNLCTLGGARRKEPEMARYGALPSRA
jgi:hypothetical protein